MGLSFSATRWFSIEQTSRNSLKIVVRVLLYSWKHRYPERRSAFTYWENDIPSRLDLGKQKYGGPFTYEQVEDVKTMFKLLLLMVSLFGYHLSGDGYSLTHYIMSTMGCPMLLPSVITVFNPQHITVLVVVLVIPVYQFKRKFLSRHTPSLLNRILIGLVMCLVSECIQCNYSLLLQKKEFNCPEVYMYTWAKSPLIVKCLVSHMKSFYNNSCQDVCSIPPVNDFLIYLSALPLIINGLSYLLVFVTTIEFICAQSPNAMKGLLIGVWYSMLSVKCSVASNLDTHPSLLEVDNWCIYHGIKGLCIFLSIVSFSFVFRHYKYRERDEIVNEQAMIEEVYERELLLNSDSLFEQS